MAFLLKRPLILIVIAIICVVIIIQFSRAPISEPPPIVITPTLTSVSISMNQNTTLTVVTENQDTRMHSVEYRITGTFNSDQLKLYFKNGTLLPSPVHNGTTYTTTYPLTWTMDIGSRISVSVLVKGLDPKVDSIRYIIFLEVWADGTLSERKSIQLTVNSGT